MPENTFEQEISDDNFESSEVELMTPKLSKYKQNSEAVALTYYQNQVSHPDNLFYSLLV